MLKWQLTGTANQIAIAQEALNRIHFPWKLLQLPGVPELGWRDLNRRAANPVVQQLRKQQINGRHHEGETHALPEPLYGHIDGRRWVMGVFYPGSGRIYIDIRLEQYPEIAHSVVSAEIAHAVDEFLPLTDQQRTEIMKALHGGHMDHHTWWEKVNYSTEYFSLIGETFMILFTKAYSDIPFGDVSSFVHTGHNMTAEQIRKIIGIERTDAKQPEPEVAPAPPSVPDDTPVDFVHYPKSGKDIFHKPTHKYKYPGTPLYNLEGFRACKVCKPKP